MAPQEIQDPNPERRNLTVLSLAIILFYFADGSLVGDDVRLHIINVKFSRPDVIVYFMWIALGWFLWRYWQTNRGKYYLAYMREVATLSNNYMFRLYASKLFELAYDKENGFNHVSIVYEQKQWIIKCQKISSISYNKNGKVIGYGASGGWTENVPLSGLSGFLVLTYLRLLSILSRPAFTSYIVPYILFIWAVILLAKNHFNHFILF